LVGVENGPQVLECTSLNGRVALLTLVRINFCLCFACRQTLHILVASELVNPSIRDHIAAGCKCASHWYQSLVVLVEARVSLVIVDELFLFFWSAIVRSGSGAADCTVIGFVVPVSEARV